MMYNKKKKKKLQGGSNRDICRYYFKLRMQCTKDSAGKYYFYGFCSVFVMDVTSNKIVHVVQEATHMTRYSGRNSMINVFHEGKIMECWRNSGELFCCYFSTMFNKVLEAVVFFHSCFRCCRWRSSIIWRKQIAMHYPRSALLLL